MMINFEKEGGLVPAIVQDTDTNKVLMLGYMNQNAYKQTVREGKVTFFSRTRQRLWTKGETSGNYLYVKEIRPDCDKDALLIKAIPAGPVCHTGQDTCFKEQNIADSNFLWDLEKTIKDRKQHLPSGSYTTHLFQEGIRQIAQKVGEETIELVIEAMDKYDDRFLEEAADLMYHYLVLLTAKGKNLKDVANVLERRHQK